MAANSTSFKKGHKSKGGRPKGSSRMDEFISYTKARMPKVLNKLMDLAEEGDISAATLLMNRHYPVMTAQAQILEDQMDDLREIIKGKDDAED